MERDYPDAPRNIQIAEAVSDLIGAMVTDVIAETAARLQAIQPHSADEVRRAGRQIVDFSPRMKEQLGGLRAFLYENVYRHHKVNRARSQAKRIVRALFSLFFLFCTLPKWLLTYTLKGQWAQLKAFIRGASWHLFHKADDPPEGKVALPAVYTTSKSN